MQIIAVYIVLVLIGDLGSYLVGRAVEHWSMAAGLPVFLACFFIVFWAAWLIAVRLTEPKVATKHKAA